MPTVNYPYSIPYRDVPGAGLVPAADVELFYGDHSAIAVGVFDSGSVHTVFSVEHAETLGLDVYQGDRVQATTMGGALDYYLFPLEWSLRIGGEPVRFPGQIGFFPRRSPRNILGRIVIFSRYEVGVRERTQQVQIRPEE